MWGISSRAVAIRQRSWRRFFRAYMLPIRDLCATAFCVLLSIVFFTKNHLYNNTGLYASWSLPSGVLRSYLGGTRFTYPSGRVLGHSLVPIRITARVIPLQKNLFRCAFARSWRMPSFSLRDRQAALHWLIRYGRFG